MDPDELFRDLERAAERLLALVRASGPLVGRTESGHLIAGVNGDGQLTVAPVRMASDLALTDQCRIMTVADRTEEKP